MYPVSQAFLNAVKANNRKYYWTGKIMTTAGTVYNFDQENMVKGSGYAGGIDKKIKLLELEGTEMTGLFVPEKDPAHKK